MEDAPSQVISWTEEEDPYDLMYNHQVLYRVAIEDL